MQLGLEDNHSYIAGNVPLNIYPNTQFTKTPTVTEQKTFVLASDIDLITKAQVKEAIAFPENSLDGKIIKNNSITDEKLSTELQTRLSDLEKDTNDNMADISKLEAKVSSVYTYKGSVENFALLEELLNPSIGDVYNNLENGMNYAWTGQEWDGLGSDIDLSEYLKTSDANSNYATKLELNEIEKSLKGQIKIYTAGEFIDISEDNVINGRGIYSYKPSEVKEGDIYYSSDSLHFKTKTTEYAISISGVDVLTLPSSQTNIKLIGVSSYGSDHTILRKPDNWDDSPYFNKDTGKLYVPAGIENYYTSTEIDEKMAALSGGTSSNGIRADYALKYGILDCPNGIINYSPNTKEIEIQAGVVLQAAGSETRTTIASKTSYEVEETGEVTLFFTKTESSSGTIQVGFLEAGDVFYQENEPENGTTSFLAWWKPSLGKWQFKSNYTGNVWREAIATPFANIKAGIIGITSVNYIGYRILDDDIFAQLSDIDSLQDVIQNLLTRIEALENK